MSHLRLLLSIVEFTAIVHVFSCHRRGRGLLFCKLTSPYANRFKSDLPDGRDGRVEVVATEKGEELKQSQWIVLTRRGLTSRETLRGHYASIYHKISSAGVKNESLRGFVQLEQQ